MWQWKEGEQALATDGLGGQNGRFMESSVFESREERPLGRKRLVNSYKEIMEGEG